MECAPMPAADAATVAPRVVRRPASVAIGLGTSTSSCGYCGGKNSSKSYGMYVFSMTEQEYLDLLDRGWRRSGLYLYRPMGSESCCALYTIRLDVDKFKPTKSQKKKWRRYQSYLAGRGGDVEHTMDVQLVHSSLTDEKFALFRKYQIAVHGDAPDKPQPDGFRRFLVDSPLTVKGDGALGSFHLEWRLDGKLVMVGVVDVLPTCLSSVYLYYDPDPEVARLSPGTVSALYEIELVKTLRARLPSLTHYYMGYYIHTCPKMRYKGKFAPSELLCPRALTYVPLADVVDRIEATGFCRLTSEDTADADADAKWDELREQVMCQVRRDMTVPFELLRMLFVHPDIAETAEEQLDAWLPHVGADLAGRFHFRFHDL